MNGVTRDNSSTSTVFMKAKSPSDFPLRRKCNWLIYMHLVRQETDDCKAMIEQELTKSNGRCEYAEYAKGLLLRQEGKIHESLKSFKTCQLLNPNNPQNIKQIGYSLSLLGRNQEAIDRFVEASKVSEKQDWKTFYHIGKCNLKAGDYEKAKSNLEKALSINRVNENVIHSLALTYMHLGRKRAATNIYEEAIKNNPTNGDFAAKLSLLLLDGEDRGMKKSFERLNTVLNHQSNHISSLLAYGALLQDQGQLETALAKYRVAVHNNPFSSALWNNIGLCFFGKKKYLAAIGCLKRAAYINPFNSDVAHNLGLINLSMGQFASAAMYHSQALSIARKSTPTPISPITSGSKYNRLWIIGQGYVLLAATLKNLGDTKNAKRAHQMALNMEKDDPLPPLSYALFLWETEGKDATKGGEERGRCCEEISNMLEEFHKRTNKGMKEIEPRMMETAKQLKTALKLLEKQEGSNSLKPQAIT